MHIYINIYIYIHIYVYVYICRVRARRLHEVGAPARLAISLIVLSSSILLFLSLLLVVVVVVVVVVVLLVLRIHALWILITCIGCIGYMYNCVLSYPGETPRAPAFQLRQRVEHVGDVLRPALREAILVLLLIL